LIAGEEIILGVEDVITEFPIKLRCDELSGTTLGASNDRNGT
jgi:hypothetical protein